MFLQKNKKEEPEEVVRKAVQKVEDKKPEEKEENKEENKEEKKEEPKQRIVVVKELPVQQIRESTAEDGTIIHYITTEEALSELMN